MAFWTFVRNVASISAGGAFIFTLDSGSELRNSSAESAPRANIRFSQVIAAIAL